MNAKFDAVDPLLKENGFTGAELELTDVDVNPNEGAAGCVAELVITVLFEAPNWNNPVVTDGAAGFRALEG